MKNKVIPWIQPPTLPIDKENLAMKIYQESEEVDEKAVILTWKTLLPSSRFMYRRIATVVLNLLKRAVREDRARARRRRENVK